MATGHKLGLNPSRKIGSGPDNKAMSEYLVDAAYNVALALGDPLILNAGKIEKAAGAGNAVGVFMGVEYVDANGTPQNAKVWPGAQAADGKVKVLADPSATFTVKPDADAAAVVAGDTLLLNLTAPDTTIGRSTVDLDIAGGAGTNEAERVEIVSLVDVTSALAGQVLEVRFVNHELS